jgi:hypothetical protein
MYASKVAITAVRLTTGNVRIIPAGTQGATGSQGAFSKAGGGQGRLSNQFVKGDAKTR